MADTTALKNRIRAAVKANDNQEITGPVLQQALLDMVDELNAGTDAISNYKSVEVVNDLVTGGAEKALSAEQGKILAEKITDNVAVLDENGDIQKTPFSFVLNNEYILAITDFEGKVLFGIRHDKTIFTCDIDEKTKDEITEMCSAIEILKSKASTFVVVDKNGNGDFENLVDALNGVNDTKDNHVVIFVSAGEYVMPPAKTNGEYNYRCNKRNLSIIGAGENCTIIKSDSIGYYDDALGEDHCALRIGGNVSISNITFVSDHSKLTDAMISENGWDKSRVMAYCIHADCDANEGDTLTISHCSFKCYQASCVGFGLRKNYTLKVEYCSFISEYSAPYTSASFEGAFYGHTSTAGVDGQKLVLNNSYIKSIGTNVFMSLLGAYGVKASFLATNNVNYSANIDEGFVVSSDWELDESCSGNNVVSMNKMTNDNIFETESIEFVQVYQDKEGRVIKGIRPDGTTFPEEEVIAPMQNKILVGAIFFNGWASKSWQTNTGSTDGNPEAGTSNYYFLKSSLHNDAVSSGMSLLAQNDWREYTKEKYGSYPPGGCGIFNYYPKLCIELKQVCPEFSDIDFNDTLTQSVKPIDSIDEVQMGWRNCDSQEQMNKQIDLAYEYGIDYFAFCFWFSDVCYKYVDGEKTLRTFDEIWDYIEKGVKDAEGNYPADWTHPDNALFYYLNAPNNWKVKFCVMPLTGSPEDKELWMYQSLFIERYFCSNPNYIRIGGRTPVLCYGIGDNINIRAISSLEFGAQNVIPQTLSLENPYGGFSYNGNRKTLTEEVSFSTLVNGCLNNNYYIKKDGTLFVPVTFGHNSAQRGNYRSKELGRSELPTKKELIRYLCEQFRFAISLNKETSILIYAWNEYCEGSWIMPTQEDIDNGRGYYRLEAIKETKNKFI